MRIPNIAEFLALFVSTGQLTGFSNQPGTDLGELAEPPCDRPLYTVQQGDTCNSIAARFGAPTFQIICENKEINGKCTNLRIGQEICLGRKGQDCSATHKVRYGQGAFEISKEYNIRLGFFMGNNYCFLRKCPQFQPETFVCVAGYPLHHPQCLKVSFGENSESST